jgi:hypothetical protein
VPDSEVTKGELKMTDYEGWREAAIERGDPRDESELCADWKEVFCPGCGQDECACPEGTEGTEGERPWDADETDEFYEDDEAEEFDAASFRNWHPIYEDDEALNEPPDY